MTIEEPPNLSDRRWRNNTSHSRNFVKSKIYVLINRYITKKASRSFENNRNFRSRLVLNTR